MSGKNGIFNWRHIHWFSERYTFRRAILEITNSTFIGIWKLAWTSCFIAIHLFCVRERDRQTVRLCEMCCAVCEMVINNTCFQMLAANNKIYDANLNPISGNRYTLHIAFNRMTKAYFVKWAAQLSYQATTPNKLVYCKYTSTENFKCFNEPSSYTYSAQSTNENRWKRYQIHYKHQTHREGK